jgi:hypothetical protein
VPSCAVRGRADGSCQSAGVFSAPWHQRFQDWEVLSISRHLAARTAVVYSHILLLSRTDASLSLITVLDARTACEGEAPRGAVGKYGIGVCMGESVAQCRTGNGRAFLHVGQDDPERA